MALTPIPKILHYQFTVVPPLRGLGYPNHRNVLLLLSRYRERGVAHGSFPVTSCVVLFSVDVRSFSRG